MEDITKLLKNIEINDLNGLEATVSRAPPSCVNFQKCFIPPHLLDSLNLTPGDPVTLIYQNFKFILRAFQSSSNTNNTEVYSVVECASRQTPKEYKLEKLEELKKFTSLQIDIVCDSNYLFMWLINKAKLVQLLQRGILRNLLFCIGCTLHLDAFPHTTTFGVKKIVIAKANTDKVGYINSRTEIIVRQVFTELQYQQSNNSSLMHLFGATRILNEFIELINDNIQFRKLTRKLLPPIKQVLLAGPSGCGKSALVQRLSTLKNCPLVKIFGQDIHCKDPGHSEQLLRNMIREAFWFAQTEDVCILLLEDIDVICPRGKNLAPHTFRLSSQLMQLLVECQEKAGVIVIATTNKPSEVNAGLRRHGRLAKEIFISKPSESERNEIISNFLHIFGDLTSSENKTISAVTANITPGFLGADLKLLCQMACSKINTLEVMEDKIKLSIQVMKDVLLGMKPASLRNEVEIVAGGTQQLTLGGLNDVKKQLELSVLCSLLKPHIYTRMGIQKPRAIPAALFAWKMHYLRPVVVVAFSAQSSIAGQIENLTWHLVRTGNCCGILLYGPPGCAKTSLAKALASKGNITVLYASNASIYSPYVGDAEKAIINLFHNARQNAPAVIFVDEIDSLVGSRSSTNTNDVQERVLAALLTQMDGIGIMKEIADNNKEWVDGDGVMLIAATNRPHEIDPALMRPGRFDRHIFVPPPDLESRFDILSIISKNTPMEDVDFHEIARRTEFYSGADLKNLHTETVLFAMKKDGINITKIKQSHYDEVLKAMKPSLSREIIAYFKNIF